MASGVVDNSDVGLDLRGGMDCRTYLSHWDLAIWPATLAPTVITVGRRRIKKCAVLADGTQK